MPDPPGRSKHPTTRGLVLGTGLGPAELAGSLDRRELKTPCGSRSGPLLIGELVALEGHAGTSVDLVLLARHGPEGILPAHKVNHKANLRTLQELGCEAVLAISSMGALREELVPGTLLVPRDHLCTYPGPTFFDERARGPERPEERPTNSRGKLRRRRHLRSAHSRPCFAGGDPRMSEPVLHLA